MEQYLGQDIKDPKRRAAFIRDNCDGFEVRGYMKPYSKEELQKHKELLANASIEIAEIEAEKKLAMEGFRGRLKPLKEERALMVYNIKAKAEYVREECYRYTDREEKETGFYNSEGILIECRPATADELQVTLFGTLRTGTNN